MLTFSLRIFCILLSIANRIFDANANPVDARDTDTFVQTPAGLIPSSNVHAVPQGARVQHDSTQAQIIGSDGSIIKTIPLSKSNSSTVQHVPLRARSASPTHIAPRALQSGWVAYAYWENPFSTPIAYFTTLWNVPEPPAAWNDQTVYIFNALEPPSGDAILQPVLQYGLSPAGGGEYWSIASWYLINSNIFHTSLVTVTPGQTLEGIISAIGAPRPPSFNWYSLFTVDGVANPQTLLSISTTEILNIAYETLEIYSAISASDIPSGFTMFTRIRLYLQDFSYPSLVWNTVNDNTDQITMFINMQGSTNAQMELDYP